MEIKEIFQLAEIYDYKGKGSLLKRVLKFFNNEIVDNELYHTLNNKPLIEYEKHGFDIIHDMISCINDIDDIVDIDNLFEYIEMNILNELGY